MRTSGVRAVAAFLTVLAFACGGDDHEEAVEVTHGVAGPDGTAVVVTRLLRIPDDDEGIRKRRHSRLRFYSLAGEIWSIDIPGRVTGAAARAGVAVSDEMIVVRYADSSDQVWLQALELGGVQRWRVKLGSIAGEDEVTGLGVMRHFVFSKDSVLVPIQEYTAVEVKLADGSVGASRPSRVTVREGRFEDVGDGHYVTLAWEGTSIVSVSQAADAASGSMYVVSHGTYKDRTVLLGTAARTAYVLIVDANGKVVASHAFPEEEATLAVETDPYVERSAWGTALTRFVPVHTNRMRPRDGKLPPDLTDHRRFRVVDLESTTSTIVSKAASSILLRHDRYWLTVEESSILLSVDGDTGAVTRARTDVHSFSSPLTARDGYLWIADGLTSEKPRVQVVDFATLTPKLGSGGVKKLGSAVR